MSTFIILVGFIGSGKTTLAKKLEQDLKINIVSGDPLRLMMKKEILYYHDFDISIPTEKGKTTRPIIHAYRKQLSNTLLALGQHVLYDSGTLTRSDRETVFAESIGNLNDIQKIIIWVNLPEDELVERLQNRPENTWVEHYKKFKKPVFEIPTKDEADSLLIYDQTNYNEIKEQLANLLN